MSHCAKRMPIQCSCGNRCGQMMAPYAKLSGKFRVHDVGLCPRVDQGGKQVWGVREQKMNLEQGFSGYGGLKTC